MFIPSRKGLSHLAAALVGFFVTSPLSQASFPVVADMKPMGIQAGETKTILLTGDRLADAYHVISEDDRLEVLEVKPVDSKKVEVKVKSQASMTPSLVPLRLVTKTGVANVRLLAVGRLKVVDEVEPNNVSSEAQLVELNRTIEGVITNEDVDVFAIELKEGQKLTVEVEGIRLAFDLRNRNILDPFVAILDEAGNELATSDDSALLRQDGLCTYKAIETGKHYVQIRDSSFRGSNVARYRLHVGDFPRPIAIFPSGGAPGQILEAQWIDVDGSVHDAKFQLPSLPSDRHPLWVHTDSGFCPSPNLVRVNQLPVETEAEPNDDYRKAPEFDAPLAFCGVIGKDNDFDCFSFDAIKGRKYRVQVYARDLLRASLDPVINVFGPDNKTIRSSDDVAGKMDPFIDFSAAVDGKHTVRIYDHLRLGGPAKQYRIEVAERQPNLALQLKELRRDEATPALVPSGGHGAFVVSAARSDYGEAAGIELSELPEGVTATTFDLPRGRSEIPVLLTAATDAKQASSRFQVQAHPKDAKALQVGSSFSQLHKLVLGQNRRSMFQTVTEQAVCAVVEKAPFEISLVQPKTPIVRQGSRSLTVNIKRDEGFDETVSLRTLYNPPGIGVNNSRKIAKGKDSVEIPITANGGAAIGNWPVILLATFSAKGGSQVISTNAIDLHVESQYFKYSFPKVAGQQGQSMSIAIGVEVLREFEDPTEVELVGLPKGVTSSAAKQVVSKDSTSIEFPIEIADDAKIGTHKTLNCVARMTRDGEVITQTVGTGALRIDKARPASGDVKKKMPAKQKSKPLSRLEQLRQANEGDN